MQGQPDRIEQFEADIAELRITDPSARRDHLSTRLGVTGMAVGIILGLYAYSMSYGAEGGDPALQQRDAIVLGLLAVSVTVVGVALYVKGAMSSFLRFWLVRDLHERRAQTDRMIQQLGGAEAGTEVQPP